MTQPNTPPKMNAGNPFDDMPVIFSYTRKQAIEDGVLVDLSAWASVMLSSRLCGVLVSGIAKSIAACRRHEYRVGLSPAILLPIWGWPG
jgi:hypothetical protein